MSALLFLAVIFVVPLANAQHATCRNLGDIIGKGVWIYCTEGGYSLPANFDVSALHSNVGNLKISGYNTVATDSLVPLPLRANLREVEFRDFNSLPGQPRFNFNKLLLNNRQHVQDLEMWNVKLVTLNAGDLQGFIALEGFSVRNGQLTSVAVDAFSGLGQLPSGQLAVNYKPLLKTVTISSNAELCSLDWSFLSSVSESLQGVFVMDNAFTEETVFTSKPFTLTAAKNFNFNTNKFRTLPATIYRSFNTDNWLQITVAGNPFCPNLAFRDCSCCEMDEFAAWLRGVRRVDAIRQLSCGVQPAHNHDLNIGHVLGNATVYEHCH